MFSKEEALAKIGTRVEIHHYLAEDGRGAMYAPERIPDGTVGQVIHANIYRFSDPDYEPADIYEVAIEWELPGRPVEMMSKDDYDMFINEIPT